MMRVIGSLFLTGLVLGVGPCLLSCGPLLTSYIAATKESAAGGLRTYAIFSLTRILVYCVLGVLAGVFGEFVVHQFFESKILVFLFLFFGLFLCVVGFLLIIEKFSLGQRCSGLFHRHLEQKDVKNIVIFGLIVSLAPCLPLMAVLSYIALISDHWLKGIAYMGSFGLGTAVSPMIILSLGAGWIARKVRNHQKFSRWVKILCGVILMFLGFMMVLSYGYPWVKEF